MLKCDNVGAKSDAFDWHRSRLRKTGWGVISVSGNQLSYISDGVVESDPDLIWPKGLSKFTRSS